MQYFDWLSKKDSRNPEDQKTRFRLHQGNYVDHGPRTALTEETSLVFFFKKHFARESRGEQHKIGRKKKMEVLFEKAVGRGGRY